MMSRTRQRLSILLTAILVTVLWAGCVFASDKTTVRVVSWYKSEGLLDTLKAAFEAENPDVIIEFESQSSTGYYDRLPVAVAGGSAADVAMLGYDRLYAFASHGIIQSIDNLVRTKFPLSEMYPTVQESVKYKNQFYALPRDVTTSAMYYNKNHLAAAGLATPAENWKWQDFVQYAKKLTTETRWGFVMNFPFDGFYHWWSTNSADWFSSDRMSFTLDSEKSIETFDFLNSLSYEHMVMPNRVYLYGKLKNAPTAFQLEQGSMYAGGLSQTATWDLNPALTWDVANLPYNTQPGSRVWSNLWVMPAGGKNQDAAWRVLSFFAGPKGQRIVAELNIGIPTLRSAASTFLSTTTSWKKDAFVKAIDFSVPYPLLENYDIWTKMGPEFTKFWNNTISSRELGQTLKELVVPMMGL